MTNDHEIVSTDMTPKGRNEGPRGNLTDWRPHDRYDVPGRVDPIGQLVTARGGCLRLTG